MATATTGSLIIRSRAIVDTLGLSPERPNDGEDFALRA
jgi:hypothetical protein